MQQLSQRSGPFWQNLRMGLTDLPVLSELKLIKRWAFQCDKQSNSLSMTSRARGFYVERLLRSVKIITVSRKAHGKSLNLVWKWRWQPFIISSKSNKNTVLLNTFLLSFLNNGCIIHLLQKSKLNNFHETR